MEDLKEKLIEYLESNNFKYRDSGDKVQHQCLNPEHIEDNPSAFTKFSDDGESFSHCSSCKFHLNFPQLVRFLGGEIDQKLLFKNKMDKLFKQLKEKRDCIEPLKEEIQVILPPKLKDFKANYRGISSETFLKVGAYITPESNYYNQRIIFPLYDLNNSLKGFDAVSYNKEVQPKVLRSKNTDTTTFFGFEDKILSGDFKRNDTIFICEGLFSALSFIELGYKGVFNFGVASIEGKLGVLYRNNIKNIVLVGDYDKVGFEFNKEMNFLLRKSFRVLFFKFPYKAPEKFDSNDLLKQKALEECIAKTLKKVI